MQALLPREYYLTMRSRIPDRDDATIEAQTIECLKYLAIMSMTPGRRIAVTPDVDDVWHELIVQTRYYRALCDTLPGHRFVNHESITPDGYSERVGDSEFVDEFLRWIPDYVQNFGPFTEESGRHWTVIEFLTGTVGLSLEEINALGESTPPEVTIPDDSQWRNLAKASIAEVLEAA